MNKAQRVLNQVVGRTLGVLLFVPFWILVGIHNGIESGYTWLFDREK